MPTTSNFGWTTPADTDLVKDGAAAIRTLGNNIDASLVDLKGGTTGQILSKASNTDLDFTWTSDATGIQATIFDAKGDLIAASAADTAARLASSGVNGDVLTVDTSTSTGLKWAAASGWNPNFTLLNSGGTSLTGSAVTVSFTAKQSLFIYVSLASNAAAANNNYITFNSDTATNYGFIGVRNAGLNTFAWDRDPSTTLLPMANLDSAGNSWDGFMWVYGAATSGWKPITAASGTTTGSSATQRQFNGYYKGSAITSVTLTANATTFDAGTIFVYGA